MTSQIELDDAKEARLVAQAEARGLEVGAIFTAAVERDGPCGTAASEGSGVCR